MWGGSALLYDDTAVRYERGIVSKLMQWNDENCQKTKCRKSQNNTSAPKKNQTMNESRWYFQ